jgi:hypothetical protein
LRRLLYDRIKIEASHKESTFEEAALLTAQHVSNPRAKHDEHPPAHRFEGEKRTNMKEEKIRYSVGCFSK